MRCTTIIFAVVAATLFAGCSSTPNSARATSDDDKVYTTGSRIPRSAAGTVTTTEDKNQIRDAVRPQPATGGTHGS